MNTTKKINNGIWNYIQKKQKGELSLQETRKSLVINYIDEIAKYTLDINRKNRTKIPEIIYGEYKQVNKYKY